MIEIGGGLEPALGEVSSGISASVFVLFSMDFDSSLSLNDFLGFCSGFGAGPSENLDMDFAGLFFRSFLLFLLPIELVLFATPLPGLFADFLDSPDFPDFLDFLDLEDFPDEPTFLDP